MEPRLRDEGAELLGAALNLEPLVRSLSEGFDRDRQPPHALVERRRRRLARPAGDRDWGAVPEGNLNSVPK